MCLDNSYIVCKLDVCVCARAQLNPNFMFGNPSATKKRFNYFILFYFICIASAAFVLPCKQKRDVSTVRKSRLNHNVSLSS